MTVAETLNRAPGSSCDHLASELTQGSQGDFTAVLDRNTPSMSAGICTADGVTLVKANIVAGIACVELVQDLTYLVP